MAWVCPNCSNVNDDEKTSCLVCGASRPEAVDTPAEECKIVFSESEAFREAVKSFFKKLSAPKKSSVTRRTAESDVSTGAGSVSELPTPPKPPKREKREKRKKIKCKFAKPWNEHSIKFDIDAIKAKGFVRSEQQINSGVKGYMFYKEDGNSQFIRVEMVLIQKMARKV